MKKLLFAAFIFIYSFALVFAQTYTMRLSTYQKIKNVAERVFKIVETKYKWKEKQVYWTLVDTIDGYIALHPKLSENKKIRLLCLKTLILQHMGYKFSNSINLKLVE